MASTHSPLSHCASSTQGAPRASSQRAQLQALAQITSGYEVPPAQLATQAFGPHWSWAPEQASLAPQAISHAPVPHCTTASGQAPVQSTSQP